MPDSELLVDWKIPPKADSGIYLRETARKSRFGILSTAGVAGREPGRFGRALQQQNMKSWSKPGEGGR